jgi:RimJ/RimL family protein N-acetyltransferase
MFLHDLPTQAPSIRLVKPDVDRDADLGVQWLAGDPGRETLRLMGVPDQDNQASSLELESARVQDFLDGPDQYNWMIQFNGDVVGAVWADLKPTDYIGAPAVSIMIGDPAARGKGVGQPAIEAVVALLSTKGAATIFARHLVGNTASARVLAKSGFRPLGQAYSDNDHLQWQNLKWSAQL